MTRIGTSDLDVFPLCFGGNVFGWTADGETSYELLDAFVAGGGNFVDTADGYSRWVPGHTGGESEALIGSWLADRGSRADMVIATKVGKKEGLTTLDAPTLARACDESLQRLRTDYIDLYYLHYDDASTPLEETLAALGALVHAGKVRYIAASNYSPARLAESLRISDALGVPRFVAVQPEYSLLVRDQVEGEMADLCIAESLSVLPYYPLGAGFLTGKYRTSADLAGTARSGALAVHDTPRGWATVEALLDIAARHGVEPATVALAWVRMQPSVAAPIASASRLEQLPALMASVGLELTGQDLADLDAAYTTMS